MCFGGFCEMVKNRVESSLAALVCLDWILFSICW